MLVRYRNTNWLVHVAVRVLATENDNVGIQLHNPTRCRQFCIDDVHMCVFVLLFVDGVPPLAREYGLLVALLYEYCHLVVTVN